VALSDGVVAGAPLLPDPGTPLNATDPVWELQAQIVELRIENKAKDLFIDQLKSDRETFRKNVAEEREQLIKLLSERDRLIGEQKEKLLQLEAPRQGERVHEVHADVEYPPYYGNVPNEVPKDGEGQRA
jgi:hypothetical protein